MPARPAPSGYLLAQARGGAGRLSLGALAPPAAIFIVVLAVNLIVQSPHSDATLSGVAKHRP